ncbi:hypothetical protein EXE41_18750, partial [Halorubrum sp. SD690R]
PGVGHVGPLLVARCTGCEKTSKKRTTEIVGDRSSGSFQHVCHTCQLVTWWNILEVVDDDQNDEPELVTDGGEDDGPIDVHGHDVYPEQRSVLPCPVCGDSVEAYYLGSRNSLVHGDQPRETVVSGWVCP